MTRLDDALAKVAEEESALAQQRRRYDALAQRHKALAAEHAALLDRLAILEGVAALKPRPPRWTAPRRPRSDAAIVVAMLSDTHFDETVRPEDVAGVNAYDRDIAEVRLRAWADGIAGLPKRGPAATLDGLVVLWGGDMVVGPIDLARHHDAADTHFGTLLHWSEQIAAALTMLADTYGQVHVPAVVGNHGRMTAKKRTHLAARDSLDWALAHLVARLTKDDRRISWAIEEASDVAFDLFGRRHLLTHGDQVTGGGGIGGIWPPVMRMVARKQQREAGLGRPFDHLWMGHFHQATFGPSFTVNGSLIGYDGFAAACNFPAAPPEQVAAYVTPAGIGWRTAVRV